MARGLQLQTMNAIRDARAPFLRGGTPKAVLFALATFAGADGWAWPSLETLGAAAGLSERATSPAVTKLETHGVIDVVRGRSQHTPNRYRVRTEALSALALQGRAEEASTLRTEGASTLKSSRGEEASTLLRVQGGSKRHPGRKQTSSRTEPPSEEGAQEGAQEGSTARSEAEWIETRKRETRAVAKPVRARRSGGVTSTRIASDWTPSEATLAWSRKKGVDATSCVEEFVTYWLSVPGAKGKKADWQAAFKNRVLRLIADGRAPAASTMLLRAVPPAPEDALEDEAERGPVELPPLAVRRA